MPIMGVFYGIGGIGPIVHWVRSMQETPCKCKCTESGMDWLDWLYFITCIIGTPFFLWASIQLIRLKRVRIDQALLYISNYRKEITVPLNMVRSVTEIRWLGRLVTIHFRAPTEFGEKVTFMPTERRGGFFSSHPVVSELRKAAGIQENNIT